MVSELGLAGGPGFESIMNSDSPRAWVWGHAHVRGESESIMDFQINMGIKLQGEGSNSGPPTKPSSNTMLNDQLSYKLELLGELVI